MSRVRGAVRNRLARGIILALLVPLAAYVLYAVSKGRSPRRPPAPAATLPADPPESEMKEFTFTQTEEGRPLYALKADRLVGTSSGVSLLEEIRSFEIHRDSGLIVLSARSGQLMLDDDRVSRVTLQGEVVARSASGEVIEAPAAGFMEDQGVLDCDGPVTFENADLSGEGRRLEYGLETGRLRLAGPVRIVWNRGPFRGWVAHSAALRREGRADRLRLVEGVRLEREGEIIEAVELAIDPADPTGAAVLTGNVRGSLRSAAGSGGNDSPPVHFAAERLDLFRASGRPARAVLTGAARIEGEGPEGESRLRSPRISIDLDPDGRPRALLAEENVEFTRTDEGGTETLSSRRLELRVGGEATRAGAASGDVRIAWQGPSGHGRAGADEARLGGELLVLSGGRPWAVRDNRRVTADRLEMDRSDGSLRAKGRVRAVVEPVSPSGDPSQPVLGLFESDRPLHIEASEAAIGSGGVARFRHRVNAWQDERSLQCDSLDVDENGGRVQAVGEVVVRGVREPSPGERVATLMSAPEMVYERSTRIVSFRGGAHYRESGTSLKAERIDARQEEAEGRIESMRAGGNVRFTRNGRRGLADEAEYLVGPQRITLTGRNEPARIADGEGHRSFEGPSLTIDLATDTIGVASTTGERGKLQLGRNEQRLDRIRR